MLISIFILIGIIALVYVFRRHSKGLALQQGKSAFNLPVVEFYEYENKFNYIRSNQCNEV